MSVKWFEQIDDERAFVLCPNAENKVKIGLISYRLTRMAETSSNADLVIDSMREMVLEWHFKARQTIEGLFKLGDELPVPSALPRDAVQDILDQIPAKYLARIQEGQVLLSKNS